jgi:hypothetical protein
MGQVIITKTDPGVTPSESHLCRTALARLHAAYPHHEWGAEVSGGFLIIRHRRLTGKHGYKINLFTTHDIDAAAKTAGGEILERYRQPRTSPRQDRLQDIPRDARQVFRPDL